MPVGPKVTLHGKALVVSYLSPFCNVIHPSFITIPHRQALIGCWADATGPQHLSFNSPSSFHPRLALN